jgi:hypothetical protein
MTEVGNRFGLMIDKINRRTNFIPKIANFIIGAFDKIEAALKFVANAFGGAENAMRFFGIAAGVALAAAFGPKIIAMIQAFVLALSPIWIKFALIAAGVLLVAAVIEDLYVWVTGKGKSLTEDLIGPWSEWSAYVNGAIDMVSDAVQSLAKWIGSTLKLAGGLLTFNSDLIKQGWAGQVEMGGTLANLASNSAIGRTATEAYGHQAAYSAMRAGMTNNTTVNLTVPPGTPQDQQTFLQRSASSVFDKEINQKLARYAQVYAP